MFNFLLRIFFDHVGGRVAVPDGTLFPPRCALCNRAVDAPPVRKRIDATAVGSAAKTVTIYLHLCPRHASRRLHVGLLAAAVAAACGAVVMRAKEGVKPAPLQFAAGIGLIVSGLFLINSLFFDPYFRGLSYEGGEMEIKGFGRRFRDALRPDELRVIDETDYLTMRAGGKRESLLGTEPKKPAR